MRAVTRHLTKSFIAGIIALLPIGGTVFTIIWMEMTISDSWLAKQVWYFPGLGILVVAAIIYLIGLVVSTFLGRWLWRGVDRLLHKLPALGRLYATLKQILGYGDGADGIFRYVVLVRGREHDALEIGLVTNEIVDGRGIRRLVVFVPAAPMPSAGRLIMIEPKEVERIDTPVSEALKALVSVGKGGAMIEGTNLHK